MTSHYLNQCWPSLPPHHYDDVIMTMLASQITSLTVVYSIVYSGVNQRKHQSSASLAFVREIHRGPVNFPHKWPVTRKKIGKCFHLMTSSCRRVNRPLWVLITKWFKKEPGIYKWLINERRKYTCSVWLSLFKHCHVSKQTTTLTW